jgi:uncharacterized membrane protein
MIAHPIFTLIALVAIAILISLVTPFHLAAGAVALVAPVVIALVGVRAERGGK